MSATAKKKFNLAMIAQRCGMSRMTVSRVLRNQSNVSAETRSIILKAAREAGFYPAGVRKERSKLVPSRHYAILFQREFSLNDAYFSGIIQGVQREFFEQGCSCSFGIVSGQYEDFIKFNQILRSRELDGVLVVGEIPIGYIRNLQQSFSHLILVDYPGTPLLGQPYNAICTDHVHGGHLAVSHLLTLGRRRILLIGGREGHYFTEDLLRAYRETLSEHELEFDPELAVYGDFHVDGGYRAAKGVLEKGIEFDAVFSNDEMACGAMRAVREAGLNVPADVSVVGFDGLAAGEMVTPALTTVEVDREKMGRLAARRLMGLEQEDASEEPYEKITLFPQLLVRKSCGAVT